MRVIAREPVIFAQDFYQLVDWYKNTLGFQVSYLVEDDYHYCNLANDEGVRLGIADAGEMGVIPQDRRHNSVVLQFQVADVAQFFTHLAEKGGRISFGPSFDKKDGFWFGGFYDLEGNPFWVVDENCPG